MDKVYLRKLGNDEWLEIKGVEYLKIPWNEVKSPINFTKFIKTYIIEFTLARKQGLLTKDFSSCEVMVEDENGERFILDEEFDLIEDRGDTIERTYSFQSKTNKGFVKLKKEE